WDYENCRFKQVYIGDDRMRGLTNGVGPITGGMVTDLRFFVLMEMRGYSIEILPESTLILEMASFFSRNPVQPLIALGSAIAVFGTFLYS
ncbi:hypothetical protein C5167_014799, partial [Papaver somniferum]